MIKRLFIVVVLSGLFGGLCAQIDTEFWFAAPDITEGHGHTPILLCFASFNDPADVTLTQPANPSFQPITVHLNSFDFYSLDLTNFESILETTPENTVTNYGLKVVSSRKIAAYYQLCDPNSEIYTLKGRNALGTHFIVPMQNTMSLGSYYPEPRSSIEIVATQDNTTVTIIPGNAISGSTANPIVVTLNAGQTYSIRSVDIQASSHLGNTVIYSDKPIAVNSTDDSVYYPSGAADLAADQIVPVDYAGNLFAAIWAEPYYDYETVTIFPTQNNTQIFIDGNTTPVATINVGQQYVYHRSMNMSATMTMISTDKPVLVWQLSGYLGEIGATQLPALECTGSKEVVYGRSNYSTDIIAYIVTETANISSFTIQCSNSSATLTAADFTQVPYNPAWSYCLKNFSSDMNNGSVMRVSNSLGKFHLGVLDYGGGTTTLGYFCAYNNGGRIVFTLDEGHCSHSEVALTYFADDADSIQFITPAGAILFQDSLTINDFTLADTGMYYIRAISTIGCDSTAWISDSIRLYLLPCEEPPLPDNVDSATCTFLPEGTEWGVHVDWSSNSIVSNLNSPLVGDLDNDGHPDVLCFSLNGQTSNTEHWGQGNLDNEMLVFDGVTKQLKATITMESPVSAYDAASYGLVRTSNGKGLIVTANYDYKLRAYDITSPTPSTPYWVSDVDYGADPEEFAVNVSFADFNGDGHPEVYVRNKVYNAETGKLLATVPTTNTGSSFAHYTHNTHRKLSAPMTADLSGNGLPELILGNEIYTVSLTNPNGTAGNTATLWMQTTPPAPVPVDGHAQVADFDMDGHLDVFISIRNTDMHSGTVYCYVWDVYNNTMSQPLSINTSFSGKSIPLIADIDNDGSMEMVIQCAVTNSNNKIQAYKYNAASRTFSMIWGMQPDEDSYSNSFTAFDFNLDGLLELIICDQSTLRIVNGSGKSHLTHNDTVPVYVLNSFPFSETTIMQYPVIADADADGSAEIVSVGSSQLNILKSTTQPWAPARKVWNQYMYNVTNINEDLTVPLHLFNNATPFTDPDNVVRRPFNNFLQQATTIDQYGRPFYAVPDVAVNNAATQIVGDTLLLSFSYCNLGDNTLNAPYPVMVFLNTYGGDTLCTALVNNSLPEDSCAQNEIRLPLSTLCNLPVVDSLIFAVNGNSLGIAQNGGLQPECDTTNNTTSVAIHIVPQTDTNYIVVHACDTLTWNGVTYDTSGVYIRTLANMYGCDSVVVMDLTVDPSSLTLFSDSVCQNSTYNGHGFSLSEDETSESGLSTFDRTLSNQFGCDSVIRLNLYVKPIVTPNFYANPDKAMLSENPVINFVNNTDIVELAQANYYWVWDFGDGASDTTSEAENSHLYTNWGDYTVTLSLWADGCIDTASVTVIIEADLEFPNVITPNGDGINDVFVIKNLNPDRPNKLYISDRWGKVVWSKENYKTYMKDEQIYNAESGFGMGNISDGVYYFSFYYEGVVRTIKFNGSITVIR